MKDINCLLIQIIIILPVVSGFLRCNRPGSIRHKHICFQVKQDAKVWAHADAQCKKEGSRLVTPKSREVSSLIGRTVSTYHWMGMTYDYNEKKFAWSDHDQPVNYTNWRNGEPNNASENCALMFRYPGSSTQGVWSDAFCNRKYRGICTKPSPGRGHCPPGYTPLTGNCYRVTNSSDTWQRSRKNCQNDGGDLVEIKSKAENKILSSDRQMYRGTLWIGLTDSEKEGEWRWASSNKVTTFTPWNAGQPDNGGNSFKHCALQMGSRYRNGRWQKQNCKTYQYFGCEKAPSRPGNATVCAKDDVLQWHLYQNRCYSLVTTTRQNWNGARKYCRNLTADLIVVNTSAINSFLKLEQYSRGYKNFWIGLNKGGNGIQWQWLDGSPPLSYKNWYSYSSSSTVPEPKMANCVLALNRQKLRGRWANAECNSPQGYVCQDSSLKDCAEHWFPYRGKCYSLNNDVTTWHQARERCKLMRKTSDLMIVSSAEDQYFLFAELGDKMTAGNSSTTVLPSTNDYWIGLKAQTARKFVWIGNVSLSVTFWAPGSPTTGVISEDCVALDTSGYWLDFPCEKKYRYICQYQAEGDETYYDFSYNSSVYKVLQSTQSHEMAEKQCKRHIGGHVAKVDSEEEGKLIYNEVKQTYRLSRSYYVNYWIDSIWQKRSAVQNRKVACQTVKVRNGYNFNSGLIQASGCCMFYRAVCERHMKTNGSLLAFINGNTGYTLIAKPMKYSDAKAACEENNRALVSFSDDSEQQYLSVELKVRHKADVKNKPGKKFMFWVQSNVSETQCTALELQKDDAESKISPLNCDTLLPFVCMESVETDSNTDADNDNTGLNNGNSNAQNHNSESSLTGISNSQCTKPCIALIAFLPIAILLAVVVTYFMPKKIQEIRSSIPFVFRRHSDEVSISYDAQ